MTFLKKLNPWRYLTRREASARRRRPSRKRHVHELLLESLEHRIVPAPVPTAVLGASSITNFIGSAGTFDVTFDNQAGTTTGYAPYVDIYLPDSNTSTGLSFTGATYLGVSLTATAATINSSGPNSGQFLNPLTNQYQTAPAGFDGDTVEVVTLPFGSFTPPETPADIKVGYQIGNSAALNVPQPIAVDSGFALGSSPTGNGVIIQTPPNTGTITPVLFIINKTYLGPEDETATGNDFPEKFQVTISVANGQTLDNVTLNDVLPNNMQFTNIVSATAATGSVTSESTPSTTIPGGTVSVTFNHITGSGGIDGQFTYQYYVPQNNSSGSAVLNLNTGDFAPSTDQPSGGGTWTVNNTTYTLNGPQVTVTDKSIAIQKTVTDLTNPASPGPGDTLQYALHFEVSDYFAFNNVVVTDTLSDGQSLVASSGNYSFTLTFTQHGQLFSHTYTVAAPARNADGTTTLTIDISNLLQGLGLANGDLIGGAIPNGGTGSAATLPSLLATLGGTTGTITFDTDIDQQYLAQRSPSNDPDVEQGDVISNAVSITGNVLAYNNLSQLSQTQTDTSSASVTIPRGVLAKSIYAVDGTPLGTNPVPTLSPGDTVTYLLTYQTTGNVEDLVLTDFLPLPILTATEITTFNDVVSAAAPAAGAVQYYTTDTYHTEYADPALATSSAGNSLTFTFGNLDNNNTNPVNIALLYTVTAGPEAFADGLYLTNLVTETEGNYSSEDNFQNNKIVQIQMAEPLVTTITKGVVATSDGTSTFTQPLLPTYTVTAPGSSGDRFTSGTITAADLTAHPLTSNLTNAQGNDLETYALTVENTGHYTAFNVNITDALPTGLQVPTSGAGLNLEVTDGAGNVLGYTWSISGGVLSITLTSMGSEADVNYNTDGSNVAIITFDLQVLDADYPSQVVPNTAMLNAYYSTSTSVANFLGNSLSSDGGTPTTVTLTRPGEAKALVTTSIVNADNTAAQVAIGETATYQVSITVPQGTMYNGQFVDALPIGMAFVSASPATLTGVTFTGSTNPVVTGTEAAGYTLTFNLGTIVNNNTNDGTDTLSWTLVTVVEDVGTNTAGKTLTNKGSFTWTDSTGSSPFSLGSTSAGAVTVIEPELKVTKTPTVLGAGILQAGADVQYTVVISNPSVANGTDAYNVDFTDSLPAGEQIISNPVVVSETGASGITIPVPGSTGPITATLGELDFLGSITIQYTVTLLDSVEPGEKLTNDTTTTWESLPSAGPGGTIRNGLGTNGAFDNYTTNVNHTITIPNTPVKKIVGFSEQKTIPPGASNDVGIGEIVRYQLYFVLPQGTATNLQFLDSLPGGESFVNDGTATVAFVSDLTDGYDISSSTLGTAPDVNGSAVVAATSVLPGGDISPASGSSFGDGIGVNFSLGTLTYLPGSATTAYVIVDFNALVDNLNNGFDAAGKNLSNTFTISDQIPVQGTTVSAPSPAVTVHVVEPSITSVAQSETNTTTGLSNGKGDAGDVIQYTASFSNASGANAAPAFNTVLSIPLATGESLNSGSITIVDGSGNPLTFTNNSTGSQLLVDLTNPVPVGGTVKVTYTTTLAANVQPGQTFNNTATVTYGSLPNGGAGTPKTDTVDNTTGSSTPGSPGATNGERGDPTLGANPPNDQVASSPINLIVPPPTEDKYLFSANQTGATGVALPDVVIGEYVVYALKVTLPEGVTNGLTVTDAVPAGLQYVPGSSTQIVTLASQSTNYLGTALLSENFAGTVPGYSISGGLSAGAALTLTFSGAVTTTNDNDSNDNSFLVLLDLQVVDPAPATKGVVTFPGAASYTNVGKLSYTNPVSGPTTVTAPEKPVVTPVQPNLVVTKHFSSTTPDAGDTETITLTLQNKGIAPAYNVVLSDPIASDLTNVTAGTTPAGFTYALVGTTVTYTATGPVLPGSPITFTFTTVLGPGVQAGQTLTNTATVTQAQSTNTAPSTGNIHDDSGAHGSASLTVPGPAIAKTFVSGNETDLPTSLPATDVVIGETVTYDLAVTLAEGVTNGLSVTDAIPTGMEYTGYTLLTGSYGDPSDLDLQSVTGGTGNGVPVTFNFGNTTNDTVNDPAEDTFTIQVTALVLNVPGTTGLGAHPTTLTNSAEVTYTNSTTGNPTNVAAPSSPTVTVIEPSLTLGKTISPTTADAGDTVTVTLTLKNLAGTGPAYNVIVSDPLPSGFTGALAGTTPSGFTFAYNPGTNTVTFTASPGTRVDAGASLTFTFTAVLTNAVIDGSMIANTATVTQATTVDTTVLPIADPNNRNESGANSTFDITVPNPTIAKSLIAVGPTSAITIGSTLTYELAVTLPEGDTPSLQVVDDLPQTLGLDTLIYVPGSAVIHETNFAGTSTFDPNATVPTFNGSPVYSSTANTLTLDFNDIVLPGDNLTTNNTFYIDVQAVVANVSANKSGSTVSNSATVQDVGYGPPSTSNTVTSTIVEPFLQEQKTSYNAAGTAVQTQFDAGDTVTYKVVISHTAQSTANAYHLDLTDLLAAGEQLVPVTVTISNPGYGTQTVTSGNGAGDTSVAVAISQLKLGDTVTITYQAQVLAPPTANAVAPGSSIVNTANLTDTTLPGGGRTETPLPSSATITINTNSISGIVYYDVNNDGVKQAGETTVLGGATVTLTGKDEYGNTVNLTTTSAAGTGAFSFTGLRPGTYTVTETALPTGYLSGKGSTVSIGPFFGTGLTLGADTISSIVIPAESNTTESGYNLGDLKPAAVSGVVFDDSSNDDGLFDNGEHGLAGVTVTLSGTNDLGTITPITMVTPTGGAFDFTNLRPGTYTVTESPATLPANYLVGQSTRGNVTSLDNPGVGAVPSIVVVPGQTAVSNDLGNVLASSFAGFVYSDLNNDGTFGPSPESGLAGAVVQISGTNDLGTPITASVTTTSTGAYSFTGLRPGNYTISEITEPTGYLTGITTLGTSDPDAANAGSSSAVTRTFTFAVGGSVNGINNNFGELLPASIAGFVYNDFNNNGTKDPGEPGIGGVTVTLTGSNDQGAITPIVVTTAPDGSYSFSDLRPGTYSVTETQPATYNQGINAVGTLANTFTEQTTNAGSLGSTDVITGVTVASGTVGTNYDYGELGTGLSGTVTLDHSNGLSSVTLTLQDGNGNIVGTTQTDSQGNYQFDNLPAGSYTIVESIPTGTGAYTSTPLYGAGTATSLNVNLPTTGLTNQNFDLQDATIQGSVYHDVNDDYRLDAGDTGLQNVQVTLTGKDVTGATINRTVFTDASGNFTFTGLLPSDVHGYTIVKTPPTGYLDNPQTVGTVGGTTDGVLPAVGFNAIDTVNLGGGQTGSGYNFGEILPSSLAGVVYVDANDDGVFEPNAPQHEQGLGGVRLTLTGKDDLGNTVSRTFTSNADGTYSFTGLRPANANGYTITESAPSGPPAYLPGTDSLGSVDGRPSRGTVGTRVLSAVPLGQGVTGSRFDFAELTPASISGVVYSDLNDNDIQDANEPGIANVTLTLTGTDDHGALVTRTTTSDASGAFAFNGLRPGTYQLVETQPSAYLPGRNRVGIVHGAVDGSLSPSGNPTADTVVGITLRVGDASSNNDFGELAPASLSGVVYLDVNHNGVLDGSEPGLGQVTVTLTGVDDLGRTVIQAVQTGPDGSYRFSNLRPSGASGYTLTETPPVGYLPGQDTVGTPAAGAFSPAQYVLAGYQIVAGLTSFNNDFAHLQVPTTSAALAIADERSEALTLSPGAARDAVFQDLPQNIPFALVPSSFSLPSLPSATALVGSSAEDQKDLARLSGYVFVDNNNDGLRSDTEPGIPNTTVTLTGVSARGLSVVRTTLTDQDGYYSFDYLPAGIYTVTENQPAGFLDGKDAVGLVNGSLTGSLATKDTVGRIVLPRDGEGTEYNFGELVPASISGYVYQDDNQNREWDDGEPGLPEVVVTLTGQDDRGRKVTRTTTTDGDGFYAFANLRPGTYTVTLGAREGLTTQHADVGTAGGAVNGSESVTGINLAGGTHGTRYDFAKVRSAAQPGEQAVPQPGRDMGQEEESEEMSEFEAIDASFALVGDGASLTEHFGATTGLLALSLFATGTVLIASEKQGGKSRRATNSWNGR